MVLYFLVGVVGSKQARIVRCRESQKAFRIGKVVYDEHIVDVLVCREYTYVNQVWLPQFYA